MPRPKFTAKLRDVLTSLLLALAVSLAWPAMGGPHDQHAHSGEHHPAAAHAHEHTNHVPTPACLPDLGCCVVTHCHPGVAQPLLKMPQADLFPRLPPSGPTDQSGVDPAILVPPPRPLLG
jgi:hypothetical protein